MARRLHGLAILITAVAPLILLVVIGLATFIAFGSIRSTATAYGEDVAVEIAIVTGAFDDVGAALDDVGMFIDGIATDVATAVEGIGPIGPDVRLPLTPVVIERQRILDVPGIDASPPDVYLPRIVVIPANTLDFTIPGVEPLGRFLVDVDEAGRSIGTDVERELRKMTEIPDPIAGIAARTAQFATDLRSTLGVWLFVVVVTLTAVVLAWTTTRTATALADVRRGWAMLMGREAAVAVEDLRARLSAIERALAQIA